MRRHTVSALVLLAFVAAACGQQRPEVGSLPELPEDFEFPEVTTTTVDPIPDDGTCILAESRGARIRDTQSGYEAAQVLLPGDIIVAFDDDVVTSQETLIASISDRTPGDVVEVAYLRDGEQLLTPVTLGAAPDDAAQPRLGVLVEPEVAPVRPADLSTVGSLSAGAHLTLVDNQVLALDPVAGSWQATGIDLEPGGAVVFFSGALYTTATDGPPRLDPVEGGDPLVLPPEATGFIRILTSVRGLIIAAVAPTTAEGPATLVDALVVAIDPVGGELVWGWNPDAGDAGGVEPLFGFRSPDGSQMVLTFETDEGRAHTLIDQSGDRLSGFGTGNDLAPMDALFAGWYDAARLAFVSADADGVSLLLYDMESGTSSTGSVFAPDLGVRQVWAVGNGSHVIVVTDTEASLFDVPAGRAGRLLSRACETAFFLGPTA